MLVGQQDKAPPPPPQQRQVDGDEEDAYGRSQHQEDHHHLSMDQQPGLGGPKAMGSLLSAATGHSGGYPGAIDEVDEGYPNSKPKLTKGCICNQRECRRLTQYLIMAGSPRGGSVLLPPKTSHKSSFARERWLAYLNVAEESLTSKQPRISKCHFRIEDFENSRVRRWREGICTKNEKDVFQHQETVIEKGGRETPEEKTARTHYFTLSVPSVSIKEIAAELSHFTENGVAPKGLPLPDGSVSGGSSQMMGSAFQPIEKNTNSASSSSGMILHHPQHQRTGIALIDQLRDEFSRLQKTFNVLCDEYQKLKDSKTDMERQYAQELTNLRLQLQQLGKNTSLPSLNQQMPPPPPEETTYMGHSTGNKRQKV